MGLRSEKKFFLEHGNQVVANADSSHQPRILPFFSSMHKSAIILTVSKWCGDVHEKRKQIELVVALGTQKVTATDSYRPPSVNKKLYSN